MIEKNGVSVCCIAYNQKDYIRTAIEKILNQKTNFETEIIIHDDCSTDGTTEILREYEKKYPKKIKVLYEKENQYQKGICNSMPFCMDIAKGKYIALCECDDFWNNPNKLQMQYDYMEKHPDCSFCFSNAYVLDEKTGKKYNFEKYYHKDIYQPGNKDFNMVELNEHDFLPTASDFFRREHYQKFPKWLREMRTGDKPTYLLATYFGYAHFIDKKLCTYRKNSANSATQSALKEMLHNKNRLVIDTKDLEFIYRSVNEFSKYEYDEYFRGQVAKQKCKRYLATGELDKIKKLKDFKLMPVGMQKKVRLSVRFYPIYKIYWRMSLRWKLR